MGDEGRLGRLMGRRKVLSLSLGAAGVSAALAACAPARRDQATPVSIVTETATSKTVLPARPLPASPTITSEATASISSEESWRKLSPLGRIQRLQILSYPSIEKFDARKELILASAQFYCEQTLCKIKPEEMASNVFFVSPTRFIEEAEKDLAIKLSNEEREDQLRTRVEMVNKENKSFINIDLHSRIIDEIKKSQPDVVRQLGNRDLITVFNKSLFFHLFSHMNQTKTVYSFDPFSLRGIPTKRGRINIPEMGRLEGFTFVGRQDGTQIFIHGAKEAVTELTANILGRKTGAYLSLITEYNNGAGLIQMFNQKAGITDEEFLSYVNGTSSIKDFLRKWGSIKNSSVSEEKAALLGLVLIGLYTDGVIKYEDARRGAESYLSPQSK